MSDHTNPYKRARFLLSSPDMGHLPPDRGAEVAFAGRSNAGKSSALNAITASPGLARTSKRPGRTQQLVFFALGGERRLVDLPGYGYARVPAQVQRRWARTVERYLSERRCLRGLVLVMDIRHPLTELDAEFLAWATEGGVAVHVLLTKADKLSRGAGAAVLQRVLRVLQGPDFGEVTVQVFSARTGAGVAQAREHLNRWLGPEASEVEGG